MKSTLWLYLGLICVHLSLAASIQATETKTLEFQNGDSNGYEGCRDISIRENAPDDVATGWPIGTDFPSSNAEIHSFVRFEGIWGTSSRNVPLGSKIIFARLIVHSGNSGNPPRFHRILIPWTKSLATWNKPFHAGNSTPGIQADGIEASLSGIAYGSGTLSTGFQEFDITTLVQQWSNGAPDFGFAWLPTGYDAFTIAPSESTIILNRPKLSITFSPPPAKIPDIRIIDATGKSVKQGSVTKFRRRLSGSGSNRKFYITNTGSGELGNILLVKSGKASKDFKISRTSFPVILPGQTRSFTISFRPSKSGSRSAAIKILSNDPDENPFRFRVSGSSDR